MRFKSDGRVEIPRDAPTRVRVRQSRRHRRVEQVLKTDIGVRRRRRHETSCGSDGCSGKDGHPQQTHKNGSPQAQRVRRWSGGASVAPMLAGSRRKRRKVTSSGTETAHVEETRICAQHKRREDRGAVTTPVVGTRTDRKVDGSCICQYDRRHEEQRHERHSECDGGTDCDGAFCRSAETQSASASARHGQWTPVRVRACAEHRMR